LVHSKNIRKERQWKIGLLNKKMIDWWYMSIIFIDANLYLCGCFYDTKLRRPIFLSWVCFFWIDSLSDKGYKAPAKITTLVVPTNKKKFK
jgi:hypothetical protein